MSSTTFNVKWKVPTVSPAASGRFTLTRTAAIAAAGAVALSAQQGDIPKPTEPLEVRKDAVTEPPSREEIQARLDAVEARTDTKFERLLGRIESLNAASVGEIASLRTQIGQLPGRFTFILTIVGTGVAIAAIVAAMLSYGGGLFGVGMNVQQAAAAGAQQALSAASQTTSNSK